MRANIVGLNSCCHFSSSRFAFYPLFSFLPLPSFSRFIINIPVIQVSPGGMVMEIRAGKMERMVISSLFLIRGICGCM